MLWEIWANIEGNKHFPNTRQKNKQNLGILVRFDHAVKHKSLRTPPPRINTRSSHLSLWFFSYFWDEHSPEFSTFSSACSGSSLALTYDSALVTSSTILEDLLRKSRSWTSGLMEKTGSLTLDLQFSVGWVFCHLGPVQVPVWMPQFLFRLHFI